MNSQWVTSSLLALLLITLLCSMASTCAQEIPQDSMKKRIFCNFDGCYNKRAEAPQKSNTDLDVLMRVYKLLQSRAGGKPSSETNTIVDAEYQPNIDGPRNLLRQLHTIMRDIENN
ncbi:hypothetical protein CAPTEDRAFT_195692 [Capitella teleta]|uniref:Uncharacterized protein n=1 Tax=Capitella teleta TaxID=283909 RepID=X1ZVE2_CAPTE|nr:hypothetical protein CAPTEDRAFT_195692 [Capitella teleta]|eukprot:ELT88405.1 hypothetical protein CAPTEDRAFT_195692 [Capitella teleta]